MDMGRVRQKVVAKSDAGRILNGKVATVSSLLCGVPSVEVTIQPLAEAVA